MFDWHQSMKKIHGLFLLRVLFLKKTSSRKNMIEDDPRLDRILNFSVYIKRKYISHLFYGIKNLFTE